jgi:hypothetical protein
MAPTCIILGTGHGLQGSDDGLRNKIELINLQYSLVLIAEEVDADKPDIQTVAREVAFRRRIPWLPIDMNQKEKEKAGISEDLKNRADKELGPNGYYRINAYLRRADGQRESFWLDRIQELNPQGTILIICGFNHRYFLAKKARRRGWNVSKDAYLPDGIRAYGKFVIYD